MIRIGIPRALLYYQYYPMWKTFFEQLGGEVVLSPPTTKGIITGGSSRVVAETCLPVKVFCGHILSLIGKCDYIFVPAIRSIEENAYNCSKFLGLPDLVKAVIPNCPPILDVDIDINKGRRDLYLNIYSLGRRLTWNPLKVKKASEAAWQAHLAYQARMRAEALTQPQTIEDMFGVQSKIIGTEQDKPSGDSIATIAVIGHPYVIYDDYINHRLINRLEVMKVRVLVPEMVPAEELDAAVARIMGKPYWTYEDEVTGAGGYYLENKVDGVISVVPFGCGPDSVMIDLLQRYANRAKTRPFMSLTIDEHTAEAGLVTRLEAFLDMLQRRNRQD